jgi:spore germination protein PE
LDPRISLVKTISVSDISTSATLQIGDSIEITPRTKSIAVQRQYELFYSDEGNFDAYSIFSATIPTLKIDKSLVFTKRNEGSTINVNYIDILSASSSSVLHIGSTKTINAESRTKHFRQLLNN